MGTKDETRTPERSSEPSVGVIALAFAAVYLSWGTTYSATRIGVGEQHMPPALFGGSRVFLAGCILFTYQWLRGASVRIPREALFWIVVSALLLFVGGNGLINISQQTVESGMAAVLVATTPLWMAILEAFWPRGERLLLRGWLGLLIGCGGVVLLFPRPVSLTDLKGPLFALTSAFCWALGSVILRHHRPTSSHLVTAAVQMIAGGASLCVVGLLLGESSQFPETIAPRALWAYGYLLIMGSLVGFVAFNWLLAHVPATLVGTYAYVNPLIAVVVGWIFLKEAINEWMIAGMVVILAAVALVRGASIRRYAGPRPAASGLTGYWNNPTSGRDSSE